LSSSAARIAWFFSSARQVARLPPLRPHFSSTFSILTTCFKPDRPMLFWQSPSPPSPRLRCSGSGVVQSSGLQVADVASSAPSQTSMAWLA
jgi:hypothetical protein